MIRNMTSDDINQIYLLGKRYDNNFDKQYNLNYYIDTDIYNMKCYEIDNKIYGFIIATSLYENTEILLVYVDESQRKKGIGTMLLQALEDSNSQNILLEVSVENKAAIHLYNKLGYQIVTIRKKYYNGTDAYIMKKVLK